MIMIRSVGAVLGLAVLAGCADRQIVLKGERLDVRTGTPPGAVIDDGPSAGVQTGFVLPPQTTMASWTHISGNPAHNVGNIAFSASPRRIWSSSIGLGNSRKHRITSDPIVAEGLVFTLDSRARVTATSTAGATLWYRDLTPETDRSDDASGGGISYADGRVFVTTGFGRVTALDPATGADIWTQRLGAPATGSPTVVDGLVYAISRDNIAWAVDARDGRVRWQLPGTPSVSGLVGGAGPAVADRVAVFPFASGEMVAALRQGGIRIWGATVVGQRRGKVYANVTDIVADPVIVDDVVYSGNQSGRTVALALSSGARLWTADYGAYGPVLVAGGSVFLISDAAELVRLDAATGQTIWANDLPYFRRDRGRRRKAIFAHFGPVLAGDRLWIASDDGTLTAVDPATGAQGIAIDLPGGAASGMSFAGGTMYVMSGNGQLHAFR